MNTPITFNKAPHHIYIKWVSTPTTKIPEMHLFVALGAATDEDIPYPPNFGQFVVRRHPPLIDDRQIAVIRK